MNGSKRPLMQERMRLVQLAEPGQYSGQHVECDYCAADATWYHWADSGYPGAVNRDAFACNSHVGYLNPTRWLGASS
jgi:hypothetical protein